jgi:hypothetical protein
MKKILFGFCLLLTQSIQAQNIPQDWLGDWYGVLEVRSPKGLVASINMELHLTKTDTVNNWKYTLVYDNGKKRDERKYNLIKSDSIPGLFEINENNGIIINEVQMGNRMFQRFEVMDNVIYGITTYEKGKIIWELVSDNEQISFQSGEGSEDSPLVTTYFPTNYQKAILTKKKPKPVKKTKTERGKTEENKELNDGK